jgi:hypothetical protein
MLNLRPNAPRIRELLRELEDCRADLAEAVTADQAECARQEIHAIQHSLWLAGYQPEED